MKLKQQEFCHNCQQYVIYEFDDITERQIIICPNCGHQHYRELDEGTIINIRMEGRYQQEIYMEEEPKTNWNDFNSEIVASMPINVKRFKIIGHTADGRPIVEKTNELPDKSEQSKIMTERRWGRDPRQV
jgi:DNA-directed RNA polymerase subunit M/transcription elongation factor TFIIS